MATTRFSRRIIARTIAAKLVAEPKRQSHWLKVLAGYLVEQNRVNEAELILNDISRELFEQKGYLLTHVTSARPLSETARTSLEHYLRQATEAKHVTLTESVDPSLLGGLIAKTADAELDASVRTKLNRLATIT